MNLIELIRLRELLVYIFGLKKLVKWVKLYFK